MALIEAFYETKDRIDSLGRKSKRKIEMNTISCDICSFIYNERSSKTRARCGGKIASGRNICTECVKSETKRILVEAGTRALTSFSIEDRKRYSSEAGKKAASIYDPAKHRGRFTRERWDSMTPEDQHKQVMRASVSLQEKLKDPIYAAQHFAKVMSQTKIGYMSKGHKDLHNLIETMGFKSHVQISNMQVDECNEELKIVVEYNGDLWHCNPRTWNADEYNSAIRMTAGEKWQKDRIRRLMLEKAGYKLIVVWESEWQVNARKYIDRIKELYETEKYRVD